MFKRLTCCLTLLAIAIGGPADTRAQASRAQATEQLAELPPVAGSSVEESVTAIETWLSSQFDLPAIRQHPGVEFAPPAKIAALRFMTLLSDPGAQIAPNDRVSSAQYDTVAVYHNVTRTIYLPESWTGGTPAELSVLVHELVHHFQNVLGLKYECPQEREKLAYIA